MSKLSRLHAGLTWAGKKAGKLRLDYLWDAFNYEFILTESLSQQNSFGFVRKMQKKTQQEFPRPISEQIHNPLRPP